VLTAGFCMCMIKCVCLVVADSIMLTCKCLFFSVVCFDENTRRSSDFQFYVTYADLVKVHSSFGFSIILFSFSNGIRDCESVISWCYVTGDVNDRGLLKCSILHYLTVILSVVIGCRVLTQVMQLY